MASQNRLSTDLTQLEKAFSCTSHSSAIFIVIRSLDFYETLVELNKSAHCEFKWFSSPDPNDALSDCTALTQEQAHEYGAIRLEQPMYLYEKKRKGYKPSFLFGRFPEHRRLVDVAFSREKSISRVCFGLFPSLEFHYNWMIQSFGSPILVNGLYRIDKWKPLISLHPDEANLVRINNIELELYCDLQFNLDEDVERIFDLSMRLDLNLSYGSSQASTTTIAESLQESDKVEDVYLLHQTWESSDGNTTYILAMDPWTCVKYIAKPYALDDRTGLEKRVQAFQKLPVNGPFVLDERIIEQRGRLLLLSRYREVESLESKCQHIEEQFARRLLWNLIRIVAILHEKGIVHGKINPRTVLLEDDNPENLLLAGFSRWSFMDENADGAKMDCFQVFQTVREFLGKRIRKLKEFWTGNSTLDILWTRSIVSGIEAWSDDALDICSKMKINPYSKAELWTTVKASKRMTIRYYYRDKAAWLNSNDVKHFVVNTAVARMATYDNWKSVDRIEIDAQKTLSTISEDGYFEHNQYERFCSHIRRRHGLDFTLESLSLEPLSPKDSRGQTISAVTLRVDFHVPYNARYGIINLKYLWRIDTATLTSQIPLNIIQSSLEVRGYPKAQGVYVSVDHFPALASALELQFDKFTIQKERDSSMDEFTYHKYFLLAPNESSELFTVDRQSLKVRLKSGKDLQMAEFIAKYFPDKEYLNSVVEHDPRLLFEQRILSEPYSFEGLAEPSEDSENHLRFRRVRQPASSRGTEKIEEWVEGISSANRKRRLLTQQPDIPPTQFE